MTDPSSVPRQNPTAAYLHIPFCAHHCGYCDFAVTAGRDELIDDYLDALELELNRLAEPRAVRTIFIGGGTPTYLNLGPIARLLAAVNHWFPGSNREFSIESTPDSLDADKIACLKDHGVTRISVGIQSFRPDALAVLDRRHRAEQIPLATTLVRDAGLELSLDLIFGAPGSTLEGWTSDLHRAIDLQPDHVSTYGLTYETGTPLWKNRKAGRVIPLTDDTEAAMYDAAMTILPEHGYPQYEVSNFAKPGKRCRHNETYWSNGAHFGFGVGAAAYVDGVRTLNCRNTVDYITRLREGRSPVFQSEQLVGLDLAGETVTTQLRRIEGIEWSAFREQTGFDLKDWAGEKIAVLSGHGLLTADDRGVRLTRRGFPLTDAIIVELLAAFATSPTTARRTGTSRSATGQEQ
jgi:oxygen-independent coproporphyrinogen-3 oxidase